jgi:mutator protein MutT
VTGGRRQVVVAAVIERGGWILIAQRERGRLAGLWEFPGGKREAGETDQAALRREISEELGIAIDVGDLLERVVDGSLELRFHACSYPGGGRPRPLGCAQFRWVRAGDLVRYAFPAANGPLVERLAVRIATPPSSRNAG